LEEFHGILGWGIWRSVLDIPKIVVLMWVFVATLETLQEVLPAVIS